MTSVANSRPLVAHVVFRFDVGGLENGVANLINRMPVEAYRHAVIALTEVTDFRLRIGASDVEYLSLHKPPGHGLRIAPRLYRLFRRMRPAIVHTRNLAALEATLPAWAAGVPVRVHGEHGWDSGDVNGVSRTKRRIRRLFRPFVSHYIALSEHIERYLAEEVAVEPWRIAQIYNGVDVDRFAPAPARQGIEGCPFDRDQWIVGTVGRLASVKDQATLVRAVAKAAARDRLAASRLRLVVVGEGPERRDIEQAIVTSGAGSRVWLSGERADIAEVMRGFDCFVLPSLLEGVSNTVLEAMATGLPVIATAVGGNPELIQDGENGLLVPPGDADALATALLDLMHAPERARRLGTAARSAAERRFSLDRMVEAYRGLYDTLLARRGSLSAPLLPARSA